MSSYDLSRHDAKQQLWLTRLADFNHSGLTVAQFCRTTGCSVAAFYQWKRKLRPQLANLAISRVPKSTFVKIETAACQANSIEIKLPNGIMLSLPLVAVDSLAHILAQLPTTR